MTKLSHQLNQENPSTEGELNGFIEKSPIYVTTYPPGGKCNGHAGAGGQQEPQHSLPEPELELKQDLEELEQSRPALVAAVPPHLPPPAALPNGGTELLIGPQDQTRIPQDTSRPRRRSGEKERSGGTEVGEEEGIALEESIALEEPRMMVTEHHRELPVDVPDSFMPRNKTPPRYPPPRTQMRPPLPPPVNNNNTDVPTKQQLDSIRKFQEQLRKRKEDEERAQSAAQEQLNRSLRGSKKLQSLQESVQPIGQVNDGFTPDLPPPPLTPPPPQISIHSLVGYEEVLGAVERVEACLKKSGLVTGGGSLSESGLASLRQLVRSPAFRRALATHSALHHLHSSHPALAPATSHAHTIARDCVESLGRSCMVEASELTEILSRYEIEGLLYSHDRIARELGPTGGSGSPSQESMAPLPEANLPPTHHLHQDSNIKIIKIEKTNEPLGATVRNEGEAVIIGRVVRGGAAEKSGLLHEGDEVLEVNGLEMRGKSVNEVCDLLSTMTGTLTFIIVPSPHHLQHNPYQPQYRDTLMHMKANFDYDPEDDLYIPCRELGISFQKGDILHVICQDDPNWWQAYREGEEDQTLAGLIPSKSFQHQRESMKQAITGDRLSKEKTKKAGTFLCAKKNTKKKKKKTTCGGYDSGYPIYTSSADDYEVEEMLTYDEVALYYPRANHKRPIVLIGPPNIGRHELRQRLMEDSERFAAAVPHTSRCKKEGEVDGQDYHFITRAQFEADILARKFVEHGEYEKAYYGTSLDAIRSVVCAGKICVLNLHPQSLRILRNSDLKPYVVFVAPPSLEKLRQKKIRNGESYKEEELKEIIEKAREMEERYGHYFDMIINNNDTERAYHQLLNEINILEREPQWVPAHWLKSTLQYP